MSEENGSTVAVREPQAVPADIVARARLAMRQANSPAEVPPATPANVANVPEAPPSAPANATGPSARTNESQRTQPGPAEDAGERPLDPEDAGERPLDPYRQGAAEGEAASNWQGYNPDYVADQMVPLIHARATRGWRRLLGLAPSRDEIARKERQAVMCTNFGAPVKIVLANPRGYAGKTVMTLCLAGTLGVARGGGVCAFENHELRGVMALRTVANGTQRTTRDFINDLSQMRPADVRHADLTRYVRHQHAGNFDAMVTSRAFEKQLDGAEHRAASALLERFYQIIVIDTANNEGHEAFQAAIGDATALVVPTKWRPTHISPAVQMLNDLASRSPRHEVLVQNAVVVATNGRLEDLPGTREFARPMFSDLAADVVEIPADPHIEADMPIVHDQLRSETRAALDQLGAAVCRAASKNLQAFNEMGL